MILEQELFLPRGHTIRAIHPVTAQAGKVWLFEGVYIEDVAVYRQNGNSAVQVRLVDDLNAETPTLTASGSFNCNPTSQGRVVGMWAGGVTDYMQSWLSTAMAAQAQGLPVDIFVEDSDCDTNNNWLNNHSTVNGLGLQRSGIKVHIKSHD